MLKTALLTGALREGELTSTLLVKRPTQLRPHRANKKTNLLAMNLTFVLLLTCLLSASAKVASQNVSFSGKNVPLKVVFSSVEKQTGYVFLYTDPVLRSSKPISVNAENIPLREFLDCVFESQPLKYNISGQSIFITPKSVAVSSDRQQNNTAGVPSLSAADTLNNVRGRIVDEEGKPVIATVMIKGKTTGTITRENGEFEIKGVEENAVLVFSGVSIETFEVKVNGRTDLSVLSARAKISSLDKIVVGSNGYQDIPKERSTGSFEVITAKMLQHSSSPNLLQRLEGITNSVVFNNTLTPTNSGVQGGSVRVPGRGLFDNGPNYNYNGGYSIENMTIRGRNSLNNNASGAPLVVIDGIANAYDISLLNPDDVESITILKDAASASIWGSRAANGVLVIKTKRGKINQPLRVSFNTNISVGEKLDLFYLKKISTSDYIDIEITRFNQQNLVIPAAVPGNEPSVNLYSPVQEILDAMNKGTISVAEGNAQIDALRGYDIRNDQKKYLLRNPLTQNYSLNLSGGTQKMAYTLTGGYSTTEGNTVNNSSNRINAAFNMQLNLLKNLSINAGVSYNVSHTNGLGTLGLNPPTGDITVYSPAFTPYTRLADEAGNPLPIYLHRPAFLKALSDKYGNKILDNTYYPLRDINESYSKTKRQNLGLTVDLRYRLNEMVSASVIYNYNVGSTSAEQYYSGNSYYMRDLINLYTDPATLARAIPPGGLLLPQSSTSHNQTIRGLVSFGKTWNETHEVNASAGLDIAEQQALLQPMTGYYGYDPKTRKTTNVRFLFNYPVLYTNSFTPASVAIPNGPSGQFRESIRRTVGQFFNVGYTYKSRYTLTGSVRKDGDNTFGDKTNRTGTPFYHLGAGWNIMNEEFYRITWLPLLKLRYTFGYNGNSNLNVTAEPRINLLPNAIITQLPYATVSTLSNPELRPERTGIHNIGLDFGFTGGRITGSAEYYVKTTTDLLAAGGLDPTLGISSDFYNLGNIRGEGIDIGLNSVNLQIRKFSWSSNFHLSYNRVKVKKNYLAPTTTGISLVRQTTGIYPEGSNLPSLYAYRWAGLSPVNGEARVFIDGVPNNGATLTSSRYPISSVVKIGSSVPVYYGNLGNTIQYAGFGLNFNILYKLGYYQRRPIGDLFMNTTGFGAEYVNRWQKPGDEAITNVPSLDYARSLTSPENNVLYQYADINTYKADNIRLQEINLSYSPGGNWGFLKGVRFYVNMPVNLILWRANKLGLDPDIYDYPAPRIYTFGFSTQFK